jgi:hypothetical protein
LGEGNACEVSTWTSDILFRSSDGGVASRLINSNGKLKSTAGLGSVATDWAIAQTGDFNGDGFADLLWHDTAGGGVALWLMNGATVTCTLAARFASGELAGRLLVSSAGDRERASCCAAASGCVRTRARLWI